MCLVVDLVRLKLISRFLVVNFLGFLIDMLQESSDVTEDGGLFLVGSRKEDTYEVEVTTGWRRVFEFYKATVMTGSGSVHPFRATLD